MRNFSYYPLTVICCFAFTVASSARAIETDFRGQAEVSGFFRDINSPGFSQLNTSTDSYDTISVDGRISEGDFHFKFRPELRALFGKSSGLPSSDPAFLSVQSPKRFVDTEVNLSSANNFQLYEDFERLDLTYSPGKFEIYAGRRPISLGVLKIFPVWNKFTRPLPGIAGPIIIYGSDGAGMSYQWGEWLFKQINIVGQSASDQVSLAEATWYSSVVELHLLAAQWWQNAVFGLSFAFDSSGTTFRGEALDIGVSSGDSDQQIQFGLGFERAIGSEWTVLGEFFYQSIGKTNVLDYPIAPLSRFSPLRALDYACLQITYQSSPVWSFGAGILTNLVDLGNIIILRANNSITENTDLFLEGDIPAAREGAEFATRSFIFSDGSSFGTPFQIQIGLKTNF